jgi:hypothetical protein
MTPTLKPNEIAPLERLFQDAIYRATQSGDLPARKVCGRLRAEGIDYEAWKQRHRVEQRIPPFFNVTFLGVTSAPLLHRRQVAYRGDR